MPQGHAPTILSTAAYHGHSYIVGACPCGQYISNRDKWSGLSELFGALRPHHDDHKILKALPRCKGLGRGYIALLGFVFLIDLLDLPAIDAQTPFGQQGASQALQQALGAPA